jgi:hypothetical protein
VRRSTLVVVPLLISGLIVGTQGSRRGPEGTDVAFTPAAATVGLPAGWRWESYRGVEVGVPGSWGWDEGPVQLALACADLIQVDKPVVGRPGGVPLALCGDRPGKPRYATLLAHAGSIVFFESTDDADGARQEGDRVTVRLDGTQIGVQAPAELRSQILGTIHRVDVDSSGCPTTDPISDRPERRPPQPVDVRSLRAVTDVAACRYEIGDDAPWDRRLVSSVRITGGQALQAVAGIAAAPVGGGPDRPGDCLPEVSYGEAVVVLRVRSPGGLSQIYLRFSGCDHNGFDDGVAVRALTRTAVAPFLTGQNQVQGGGGPVAWWSMEDGN